MRQTLNLDVLGLVCDSLHDTATVLSVLRVSRALHTIAVRRLLSMKPIILKDGRSVGTFHAFVFSDPESRLPFVRALIIDIPKIEEHARAETAQRILNLLERAPNLESLTLPEPKWTFKFLADKRIPEAISQISTLRELGLLEECDEMASIVRSTRSAASLRVLRVSLATLPTSGGDYALKVAEFDAFLRHLTPTLEVLDIRAPTLKLDAKGVQYHALRSLMVPSIDEGIIRTDILVSKFPALDGALGIGSVYGDLQDDEQKQRRIRTSNQERQHRRCWKGLDCLTGDVPALFVLGLKCPVRHLVVSGPYGEETNKMAEILRDTSPTHLNLSTVLDHGDDFLADLFPPEIIPRLTHLLLLLEYHNGAMGDEQSRDTVENMQWSVVLAKIIDSIRALRLTHFRLFVHYDVNLEQDEYYAPYSKDFVRSVAELDHAHLAAQLMDAVPSLEHVFVSAGGQFDASPDEKHSKRGRWFAHSGWKRVSGGTPEKLDDDVTERMLREQDLGLSYQREFSLGLHHTWATVETAPWPLPE